MAGDEKIFLLGVGCQKGGTSWLHDYLARSKRADFGPIKEYHVFDHRDGIEHKRWRPDAAADSEASGTAASSHGTGAMIAEFRRSIESYYDFFLQLLSSQKIILTGDMTPAYSLLSTDCLRSIKDNFADRGVTVRAIFLMRDPVERIWSSLRMRTRRQAELGLPTTSGRGDEALLLKTCRAAGARSRTEYHRTIAALEQVFAPDDILYGFYERLFCEAETRRICDFLRIPFIEPQFDKAVNASPKSSEISAEAAARVAQAYADVYRFVAAKFGSDLIREIWPSSVHVPI